VLTYILASTILVSLISLVGVALLPLRGSAREKALFVLVSFAAGTMLGAALLDLLPEGQKALGNDKLLFQLVLLGIVAFFVTEKLLMWYHCHNGRCRAHTYAHMSLVGDAIHNFLDGVIIAAAYLADFATGVAATLAVAAHEIPQEFGDFSILLRGGFSRRNALLYNFATALTAIAGALVAYFFTQHAESFAAMMLPFAAGGFIYIASADLFPELRKHIPLGESLLQLAFIILGIAFIFLAGVFLG